MIEKLHWLGHASFRIDSDQVIYIDPYKIKAGAAPADLICVTHEHYDHLSPQDIRKIATPQTVFVAPASVAKALSGDVRVIRRGEKATVGKVAVEAVAAYNIGKDFHPRSSDNVGYIITVEGARIYHSGDTDVIPEMGTVKADIVLLPCGGTYTMTAKEAAGAVEVLHPKIVVPMHWGSVVGSRKDAEEFQRLCKGCEVRILDKE